MKFRLAIGLLFVTLAVSCDGPICGNARIKNGELCQICTDPVSGETFEVCS